MLMRGGGFGVLGNIVVGVIGALIGGFLFSLLGITAGGLVGSLVTAVAGAAVLLLIGNVFFALQHPIGWLGVILVLTGLAGICPVYSLLGINTKSAAERVGLK